MRATRVVLMGVMALLMLVSTACSGGSGKSDSSAGSDSSQPPAGSSASAPAPSESQDSGGKQVSIRFTWWGDTKRHEKYNAIADLFEKENPNIKVVREFGSWDDYWDKMATQTAGGNAPDVVGMHATQVANYAQRGALLDITQYVDSGIINLDDFPPSVVEVGKLDGKILMVAQGVTMTGMIYNSGMLEKIGVQPPDFNWSWDDFAAKTKEVQQAIKTKGTWASADLSADLTSLMMFARQRGKNVFNEDGSLGVEKQDMVDWFGLWDRMRKDKVIPDAAANAQYANVPLEQSMFITGKVAFTAIPFNQVPNYQNFTKDGEVRPLRRPTDPKGETGEFIEGAYLSVSKTSKNPEAAAKFISFFVNNEEAVKIFKIEQGALGSTKANEIVKPLLDPAQQRAVTAIQETLKIAGTLPLPPAGQGQVAQVLTDEAEALSFGKISVEKAAEQFISKAQGVLKK